MEESEPAVLAFCHLEGALVRVRLRIRATDRFVFQGAALVTPIWGRNQEKSKGFCNYSRQRKTDDFLHAYIYFFGHRIMLLLICTSSVKEL